MIIERTQRMADKGFEFLKAGVNGRKTNCARLSPTHATGHENYQEAEVKRFVAFGDVAESMRQDWAEGIRTFKIERGQPRDNDWVTDEGEVRHSKEMIVREYTTLKRGKVSAEQAQAEAEQLNPVNAI